MRASPFLILAATLATALPSPAAGQIGNARPVFDALNQIDPPVPFPTAPINTLPKPADVVPAPVSIPVPEEIAGPVDLPGVPTLPGPDMIGGSFVTVPDPGADSPIPLPELPDGAGGLPDVGALPDLPGGAGGLPDVGALPDRPDGAGGLPDVGALPDLPGGADGLPDVGALPDLPDGAGGLPELALPVSAVAVPAL